MQRDAGVPSVVVSIVEALIVLGLVVGWPVEIGASNKRTRAVIPVEPEETRTFA